MPLCIFAFIILLPVSPYFLPILGDDSGIFAYIGRGMLEGQRLYVDLWENKGPLIFFINAFALKAIPIYPDFGGGLWVMQIIFLLIGVSLSYYLLSDIFNRSAGFFGTLIWLTVFASLLYPGNFTEIYAIPIQWISLYLFWKMINHPHWVYRFLIGICAAGAFLLRANIIAIPAGIAIFILITRIRARRWKDLLREGGLILSGFTLAMLLTSAYFLYIEAFKDFIDAAIRVNFIYISQKTDSVGVLIGDIWQRTLPLAMLAIAGMGAAIWNNVTRQAVFKGAQRDFLWLAVIAYPLEIYFSTLSGHRYGHYYISALAISGVLVAALIYFLTSVIKTIVVQEKRSSVWITGILFAALLPMLVTYTMFAGSKFTTLLSYAARNGSLTIFEYDPDKLELAQYIEQKTEEGDLVWIWANKASVNFYTKRKTLEPYIFPHALLYPNFVPDETLVKMLDTLEKERPIIIDMSWNDSILPSISSDCHGAPSYEAICTYISQHYQVTRRLHAGKSKVLEWVK
jgi:hypothetical protein